MNFLDNIVLLMKESSLENSLLLFILLYYSPGWGPLPSLRGLLALGHPHTFLKCKKLLLFSLLFGWRKGVRKEDWTSTHKINLYFY